MGNQLILKLDHIHPLWHDKNTLLKNLYTDGKRYKMKEIFQQPVIVSAIFTLAFPSWKKPVQHLT